MGKGEDGYFGDGGKTMSGKEPIAHVRQKPDGEWETHDLAAHGEGVAQRAACFATEWARGLSPRFPYYYLNNL